MVLESEANDAGKQQQSETGKKSPTLQSKRKGGGTPTFTTVPDEWYFEFPKKGYDASNTLGGCRRVEDAYERIGHLGQGTYGEVFKAKDRETGEVVAIKKIKMENEKEGFPITAVREIKILSMLASSDAMLRGELMRDCVIRLREIARSDASEENDYKGSVYMVFDYMEHDLSGLLERANQSRLADAAARGLPPHKARPPFQIGQVKRYMMQLILGLQLLQRHNILHRDLKNANLLVNNKGQLKIADFGLARSFYKKQTGNTSSTDGLKPDARASKPGQNIGHMTNRVITLWYRPPELCLGSEQYGLEVDMWSAGCILVEMLSGRPLFPGKDEVEQVKLICHVLGMPDEKSMPGCTLWKDYDKIMMSLSGTHFRTTSNLRSVLRNRGIDDDSALDLIEHLLALNPSARIPAREAVRHRWFTQAPKMLELDEMPRYEESHELSMKKRRTAEKNVSTHTHPSNIKTYEDNSQESQYGSQGRHHKRSIPKWQGERR